MSLRSRHALARYRPALLATACAAALSAAALSACAPNASSSPTRTATSLDSQIAAIRRSATVAAERLQITLVDARQRLQQISTNTASLSGTLRARGYEPDTLAATPAADSPAAPDASVPPGTLASTLAITPPGALAATDDAERQRPSLSDFRVGRSVGADDCVSQPQATLPRAAERIYTSARARNLAAGATLITRWFAAGVERTSFTYTAERDTADHCFWFYIEPSDTPFTPGEWTVRWEMDGAAYPPQPFRIVSE